MRKIAIIVCLLFLLVPASAVTHITDCNDLQAIKDDLAEDYVLDNDIDCSDTENWDSGDGFVPIGTSSNKFTGSLDGQNYKVRGLYICRPEGDHVGLFGYLDPSGKLEDVGVIDADVSGEDWGTITGILVGSSEGEIENCYTSGSVSGSRSVGGLVGYNSGDISESYSTADVDASNKGVGGLCGANNGLISNSYFAGTVEGHEYVGGLVGNNNGEIEDSYAVSDVRGSSSGIGGIGGLVGFNGDGDGQITRCFATGDVEGKENVGGLVGDGYHGHIEESFATGDVECYDHTAGGLVGNTYTFERNEITVLNSYATGDVKGNDFVGGLVGYNGCGIMSSYSTGNVEGNEEVGGLVAMQGRDGTTTNSFSTGNVEGNYNVGGLMGTNYGETYDKGEITNCFWYNQSDDADSCTYENKGVINSCEVIDNEDYFYSSNNGPLDEWGFGDVWEEQGSDYPTLQWADDLPDFCGDGTCKGDEDCDSCEEDCGCSGGDICCDGECEDVECCSESDCDDDESCIDGGCITGECDDDNDCDSDEVCCDNECEEGDCCSNSDCDSDEICEDNECVLDVECESDSDCGSDEVCCDNECEEPECFTDSDCDTGQDACIDFECEAAGSCNAECEYDDSGCNLDDGDEEDGNEDNDESTDENLQDNNDDNQSAQNNDVEDIKRVASDSSQPSSGNILETKDAKSDQTVLPDTSKDNSPKSNDDSLMWLVLTVVLIGGAIIFAIKGPLGKKPGSRYRSKRYSISK